MKEVIKDIINENQNTRIPDFISRSLEIPVDSGKIISVIGVRRSGKTFLLYQTMTNLIDKGINREHILYLNFEDERLAFDAANLDLIIQSYQEIYPGHEMQNVYFFFDEIQNITGWEKFIRRIYDSKSKKIFITGSNAKLLSTEIATALRGRSITYTVYPLSYLEYLKFLDVPITIKTQKGRSHLLHLANQFMMQGGFPELVFISDKRIRRKVLQEYFNVMIFRDIIERYHVSNVEAIKFFIKKIFAGVTKPFSVNKAYRDLKSLGYKISNKYLYEYQDYCDSIFLSQSIAKYDHSSIKTEKSEKKSYIIDNGLLSAVEFSVSKNMGKLLENMVYLEFLKQEKDIYYFRDYYECDLLVITGDQIDPIQVSYTLQDSDTKQRELKGLAEACRYLNTESGTIITFDEEGQESYQNVTVKIVPFYKYFI